jgi:hypothetical protein
VNVETQLRKLEASYRQALSGAVVAKARYLARAGDRGAGRAQTARLQQRWQKLERQRHELAERMARLEAMENSAIH